MAGAKKRKGKKMAGEKWDREKRERGEERGLKKQGDGRKNCQKR